MNTNKAWLVFAGLVVALLAVIAICVTVGTAFNATQVKFQQQQCIAQGGSWVSGHQCIRIEPGQ